MSLLHKGCGGEIQEDHSIQYEVDKETGGRTVRVTHYPAYRCIKCQEEILGDAQLEWDLTQ